MGMGPTARPSAMTGTNVEADGVESSRSDEAQQLSASAWVTAPAVPFGAGWCIGQVPGSVQQAIRASGVASQPAQRPKPPDDRRTTSAAATMRRVDSCTAPRMRGRAAGVNSGGRRAILAGGLSRTCSEPSRSSSW